MTITNTARLLNLRARARDRAGHPLPRLLLMTDMVRLKDPLAALDRLPPGAGIILRHYDTGAQRVTAQRVALARALAPACRARRLKLIIAADPALALTLGADGLHLPEWMAARDPHAARHAAQMGARKPGFIVTCACHSARALRAAARIGADAALLAPVFSTPSHPGAPALGVVRFTQLARLSRIPVYALGGVDEAGARRLAETGAAGIAGIGFAAHP